MFGHCKEEFECCAGMFKKVVDVCISGMKVSLIGSWYEVSKYLDVQEMDEYSDMCSPK